MENLEREKNMLLSKAKRELERRYGYSGPVGINYIKITEPNEKILARVFFRSTKIVRLQGIDGVYRNYLRGKRGKNLIYIDDGIFENEQLSMEFVPHKVVVPLVREIIRK